jgi:hypothetical protein
VGTIDFLCAGFYFYFALFLLFVRKSLAISCLYLPYNLYDEEVATVCEQDGEQDADASERLLLHDGE